LKTVQHAIEQEWCGSTRYQPCSKLGEEAAMKTRIRQFQSERIVPVNPGSHGLSGLAITQVLEKLQNGYKR
jgi:hypothetical protein